jgi:hypothetical protein
MFPLIGSFRRFHVAMESAKVKFLFFRFYLQFLYVHLHMHICGKGKIKASSPLAHTQNTGY